MEIIQVTKTNLDELLKFNDEVLELCKNDPFMKPFVRYKDITKERACSPEYIYYIVKIDNKIVARCYINFGKTIWCGGQIVHPNFRRLGIQKFMINHCIEILKQYNVRRCFCYIEEGNIASVKSNEGLGFKKIGTKMKDGAIRNYYLKEIL